MPIYVYECCSSIMEEFQEMDGRPPSCPECGIEMRRKLTYPAMVKIKGWGGYPSRRKMIKDTAPYCRG